jgi:hypothetical protein
MKDCGVFSEGVKEGYDTCVEATMASLVLLASQGTQDEMQGDHAPYVCYVNAMDTVGEL